MKKRNLLIILILMSTYSFTHNDTKLININNKLAVDLYNKTKDLNSNIIYSPYSILNAFSMAYIGSNGDTKAEISNALNIDIDNSVLNEAHKKYLEMISELEENYDFYLHNSFWPQKKSQILDDYYTQLKSYYNTEINPYDYIKNYREAKETINTWTKDKTEGMIPELLKNELTPNTKWLLINTIFFNANWEILFDKEKTKNMPFYIDNSELSVPTMNEIGAFEAKFDIDHWTLKLPYANRDLSMYIILPGFENKESFYNEKLSIQKLNKWTSNLYFGDIEVFLPKFKYSYDMNDIEKYFDDFGIKKAFIKGEADFSNINGKTDDLFIDIFKHNSVIEVNESGSKASAATAVGCFPLGTLIHTDSGTKKIEELNIGDKIKSYNFQTKKWENTDLLAKDSFNYGADMIEIYIGNEKLVCTGTQPVFVLEGKNLKTRKRPSELHENQLAILEDGRWVEARDLKPGDKVLTIEHGVIQISNTNSFILEQNVYHLTVDKNHNHGFSEIGLLVHNNNSKESGGDIFQVDKPFIYFIKDERNGMILFIGKVLNPLIK